MKEKTEKLEKCVKQSGRRVKALHRTKIENISVKSLKIGEWRYLKEDEVKSLQN